MRLARLLPIGLALLQLGGSPALGAQSPPEVDGLLRAGDYPGALERLEAASSGEAASENRERLAELLLEVGRYEDAESVLEEGLRADPELPGLALLLGRALLETGRLDEARGAFEQADRSGGGAGLLARYHLGEILLLTGQQEEALAHFDRFIDVYNRSGALDSLELLSVALAVRRLGVVDPVLLQDALRAYDEALAADPDNLEAHVALGELFLETYNVPEARGAFRDALTRRAQHPGALLGLSKAAALEGSPEAGSLVDQALDVNPRLVPALVHRARLRVSAEADSAAADDLERALAVNPESGEALAVLAGLRLLEGNQGAYEEIRDRVLHTNPRDSDFFVTVAELSAQRRLYAQAVELAAQGVAADSLAWTAHGVQGLNQLRTGEIEAGRRNLGLAFQGDPYNLWFKNTLDLLDVMDGFEEWYGPRVRVFVEPDDGEALAVYVIELAERALDDLGERYGYEIDAPVRIEAFRRSADFSVRTVGLTGLGALGVSFGPVVAMDSPGAREAGATHWASTLWHELAHTVHLGVTDHRVPRWITEGLAVREERRAGRGWGSRPSLGFFSAYLDGGVREPSELSRSFIRPRHPQEVGLAYVLSSLVVEWIEEEWGFDAILAILRGYADASSTGELVSSELGLTLAEFDAEFDRWLRARYASPLEKREELEESLASGRRALEAGEFDEAVKYLEKARDIFPENPDPRGPNRMLAQAHRELGDDVALAAALDDHVGAVSTDYAALLELAALRNEQGATERAIESLEAALHVYPFELDVHQRLAELYREVGDSEGEIRELRVALALSSTGRANALYRLADAQLRSGATEDARSTVLKALEFAPLFAEAQDLLLRILDEQ